MRTLRIISTSTVRVLRVSQTSVSGNDPAWYVADGTEGSSLLLNGAINLLVNGVSTALDLTDRTVTAVSRENYELMPTEDFPNNKQFNWAGETPTLTLSDDLQEGEQLKLTFR